MTKRWRSFDSARSFSPGNTSRSRKVVCNKPEAQAKVEKARRFCNKPEARAKVEKALRFCNKPEAQAKVEKALRLRFRLFSPFPAIGATETSRKKHDRHDEGRER